MEDFSAGQMVEDGALNLQISQLKLTKSPGHKVACVVIIFSTKRRSRRPKRSETLKPQEGLFALFDTQKRI